MKRTKHIKGFTILEALISLILISIIIALSYSLIDLIGKQLSLFERENSQVLEYNLFNTTLTSDIAKATDFEVIHEQLLLTYYHGDEITYSVNGSAILREHHAQIDTFKIKVTDYRFNTDAIKSNTIFSLTLNLLNEKVNANYFLDKNLAEEINNTYLNED